MNQEHETQPMRSTNFEFLRATQPKLADDAAAIESLIHERPAQAINLMRSFAEHLLHAFVIARGREGVLTTGDQGKRTIEFDQLLHECESKSSKWPLSTGQLGLFRQIKSEGNKAVHVAEYQATSPMKLLEATHTLAASIAKSLKWATPSDPCRKPPHGGEEAAELRRQRDEAMREAMQQVVLPKDWIREPKQYPPPSAPKGTFVGRESLFREINNFIAANTERVLLIEGQPGRGKSALLAHFIAEQLPTGIVPFYFFFEDGRDSIQTRGWIRHFYASTVAKADLTETDRSIEQVDPEALVRRLAVRLHEVAKTRPDLRLLLIIDAIDEAGAAKDHTIALLGETLPQTVQILATARPNHVKPNDPARTDARVLNLEQADQVHQHRNDGREYLRQQVRCRGLNLSESQIDEIGKLGDGNFLVLREICRDLPKDESQFDAYLRNLADLRGKGIPLREELERRAWDRLQRLGADELHHIQQTLGLLAISQERLPERVIKSVLKLRKADFQKVMQQAGEYVATATIQDADTTNSKDDADEDPEGLQVHRLYHATFAELVRRELKDELPEIQGLLCESCRKWWQGNRKFESAYALRHLIEHLQQVQDWAGLEAVLTDLQFIQARFEAGQGHDLLTEYDAVLEAHPEQDEEFKQRIKQDAVLHQYVQDIVEYSRRCTEIRNRSEYDDPIAEINQLKFPDPPDTTQTIKDMRRTEARQKNPAAHKPAKPTGFSRIRDFQQFVASRLQLMLNVPAATIDIARNYAQAGEVAESAKQIESVRSESVRLLQHNRPEVPVSQPLVPRAIDGLRIYDYGYGNLRETWMTPDAHFAFIGGSCDGDAIYDLRTGRNLTARLIGAPVAMSVSGRWGLLQAKTEDKSEPLTLVELTTGKILASCNDIHVACYANFMETCCMTPDGSLVVGISHQDLDDSGDKPNSLVIWDTLNDTQSDDTKTIWLEDFVPVELVLAQSGAFVAVRGKGELIRDQNGSVIGDDGLWKVFDLIERRQIFEGDGNELKGCVADEWHESDLVSALLVRNALKSSNKQLKLADKAKVESDTQEVLRQLDRDIDSLDAISADGRFALGQDKEGVRLVDLAHGLGSQICTTSNEDTRNVVSNNLEFPCFLGDEQSHLAAELNISLKVNHLQSAQLSGDTRAEMVLHIGEAHQWALPNPERTDAWKMTPDASFILTKAAATNLHNEGVVVDGDERPSPPFKSVAVTITDLTNGEHLGIECSGEWLGLTADARAAVFGPFSNWIVGFDRLRFWSLEKQDWWKTSRQLGGEFYEVTAHSPDGRYLVVSSTFSTKIVSLNSDYQRELARPYVDDGGCAICWRAFSLDGKFLVEHFDGDTYLWSMKDFSLIGIDSTRRRDVINTIGTCWIDWQGVARDGSGRDLGIQIADPEPGPAWVTAARLYRIGSVNGQLVPSTGPTPMPFAVQPIPGTFDDEITFCCRRCGRRSPLPTSVIGAVDEIHRKAHLDAGSVPVLELPDDAWGDKQGLDFKCPHCPQPHRSTPFYVDRRASS